MGGDISQSSLSYQWVSKTVTRKGVTKTNASINNRVNETASLRSGDIHQPSPDFSITQKEKTRLIQRLMKSKMRLYADKKGEAYVNSLRLLSLGLHKEQFNGTFFTQLQHNLRLQNHSNHDVSRADRPHVCIYFTATVPKHQRLRYETQGNLQFISVLCTPHATQPLHDTATQ